jgi:hypothetical protein
MAHFLTGSDVNLEQYLKNLFLFAVLHSPLLYKQLFTLFVCTHAAL